MSLDAIPLVSGSVPVVGHGPAFDKDRFEVLDRITREVEHVGRLRFITRDIVIANSPLAVHDVLVTRAKTFEKSPMVRAALNPLAGEGLFTSGGALWRRQRRLMAPVFHHAKINAYADAMVECAEDVSKHWRDGEEVSVANETTHIAMNVAGRTLFGFDTTEDADAIGNALTIALHWVDLAARSLPMLLQVEMRLALLEMAVGPGKLKAIRDDAARRIEPPILWPTARNREMRKSIDYLDERVQRMIDERRKDPTPKDDLLSHLLRARDEDDGAGMSDKQMRDEILTLFVAGHETTANGLAWSIYSLARDPALYARARATVDALGGKKPTLADMPRLSFLDCVFKEALRLYPPVYLFGRIAIEDTTIAGFAIPKHTIVLISPWTLQRRADVWRDPLRFDPDRFAEANAASRPKDAWIPFSDGPRVCIGAHFAQLEASLVLARLLQRADFELLDKGEAKPDESATLRPRDGVRARVKLRPAP